MLVNSSNSKTFHPESLDEKRDEFKLLEVMFNDASHGIRQSFNIRLKFQLPETHPEALKILTSHFWHPVQSRDSYTLNVFYYLLIITGVFCANYKVWDGFEFISEDLEVKDEEQIDFEISLH